MGKSAHSYNVTWRAAISRHSDNEDTQCVIPVLVIPVMTII